MNRCNSHFSPAADRASSAFRATCISMTGLAVLATAAALWSPSALAQTEAGQNEAALGGRNFPVGTLRGKLLVIDAFAIQLDDQPDRLSPGARIRSAQNMSVIPATLIGQKLLVNYTRDPAGLVREVWVLTPDEARAERASVARPLLSFWPFVASAPARDDGNTPFNQLPKYGE